MKKVFLMIVVVLFFVSCGSNKMKTFESVSYSIDFPAKWDVVENPMNNALVAARQSDVPVDSFAPNISLYAVEGENAEEYVNSSRVDMSQMLPELKVVSQEKVQAGENSAVRLEYAYKLGETSVVSVSWFIEKKSEIYVLTAISPSDLFETNREMYETVAASLKVKIAE